MYRILVYQLTVFFIIGLFSRCSNNSPKIQEKRIGAYLVKARFKNDSIIDGVARFYTKGGSLVAVTNYTNGIKNGYAVIYHPNGQKSDSMYFTNGVKNGSQYRYDTSGRLSSINYQYYGLRMGPQLFFEKGLPVKYFYIDFNKDDLINCKYDSLGNIHELSYFAMKASVSQVISSNVKMLELFFYLPNPPNVQVEYSIGITDKNDNDTMLSLINFDRIIFDTLLPYPKKGLNYYVSAHLKSKNGKVNKVFIEDIGHDDSTTSLTINHDHIIIPN
jgi:antitoxin component YwqK of YwqJK toxin-antitoxin module